QAAAAYNGVASYPYGGAVPYSSVPYGSATAPLQNMSMANQAAMMEAAQLASMQSQGLWNPSQSLSGSSSGLNGSNISLDSYVTSTGPGKPDPQPISVSSVQYQRNVNVSSGQATFQSYANQAFEKMGIPSSARSTWLAGLVTAAGRESSWNPSAINASDSNAVGSNQTDGHPAGCSRGYMQTIPATFARYHQKNTSYNIYDPTANIAATMNYLMGRYHVTLEGKNLKDVPQFNPNDHPQGY